MYVHASMHAFDVLALESNFSSYIKYIQDQLS